MFKIVTLTAAVALVVAFGFAGTAQAATLVVDDDGFATTADCNNVVTVAFTSIQVGVDAASAGDTVFVWPGTYFESVVIVTDDITLRGQAGAILDGTGLSATGISLNGVSGVIVEGFDIRNHAGGLFSGGVGIMLIAGSNNHVKGNTVVGQFEIGPG